MSFPVRAKRLGLKTNKKKVQDSMDKLASMPAPPKGPKENR